jgi:hypothetical protein
MEYDFSNDLICIKNRILPKEALKFFQYQQDTRICLTIASDPNVWRDDLCIAERLFSDLVIIPAYGELETHKAMYDKMKVILKERLKYPNVKENPEDLEVAKTWVLPAKLHMGPSITTFYYPVENPVQKALAPIFSQLNVDPKIHYLKIEVANGFERNIIYTILDNGFRPSLFLIKWSNDIDEDNATAYCAGHLQSVGYSLISLQNGYALYFYSDQSLYDICSFKTVGVKNPILQSILESVKESIQTNDTPVSSDSK